MQFRKKSPELIALKAAHASAIADLAGYDIEHNPTLHATALENLKEIEALLSNYRPEPLSPNTVLTTIGSVASVLVIVGYERGHVFTSQAKNFIMKSR